MNTEAFDPKKNAKDIKELEIDVARIEHRMKENEYLCKTTENAFAQKKTLYDHEKAKLDDILEAKEKIMNQMNGIMMAFEGAKTHKLQSLAEYLRDSYREMYKIEF